MEFMYNWDRYIQVIDYLKGVYTNTLNYLEISGYSPIYAQEFVTDIEEFLHYFEVKGYNVACLLDDIKDIEIVEFYDSLYIDNQDTENIIPPVLNRGIKVLLSTDIKGNERLTAKERRKLYLYQGLAHSILSFKNRKTLQFSKFYTRYLSANHQTTEMIVNNGWLLLEDTLAQELAEKITYYTLEKTRPKYRLGLENETYPIEENKILSNLEMYRMFQEITARFGLTIGNVFNYQDSSTFNVMLKYSINNDFPDIVINEYTKKNLLLELYQLLYLMGILINEKYRMYHINFINSETTPEQIDKIYDNVINLLNSLMNYNNQNYLDTTPSNVIVLYDQQVKNKIRKLIQKNEI